MEQRTYIRKRYKEGLTNIPSLEAVKETMAHLGIDDYVFEELYKNKELLLSHEEFDRNCANSVSGRDEEWEGGHFYILKSVDLVGAF